jgi:hypothetical protein
MAIAPCAAPLAGFPVPAGASIVWRRPQFTPNPPQSYAQTIAEAQVHAMLALAAATGVSDDGREWQSVAGSKFSG